MSQKYNGEGKEFKVGLSIASAEQIRLKEAEA